MRIEKWPVLVVGGGIVGLSASLFLAHQGVRALLVERRETPSVHPRSRGLNGRTMELMREVGLEHAVRDAGLALAPAIGWFEGASVAEVVGPQPRRDGPPASPFGGGAMPELGPAPGCRGTQDRIEPVLLAAARERGEVRFGTRLVGFEQHDDHVLATVEHGEERYQVRADYMIAADGARSAVREALGVPQTGRGLIAKFANVLFHADLGDFVRNREFSAVVIDRPEVRGMVLAIDNASRWVFHIRYDGEPPTQEQCLALTRLALGMPELAVSIERVSLWECAERVCERFRHGRVFLAGDAAHQMPPWGGQGANTGVADAHNLAWKLALALAGQADVLDTYDQERVPVARVAAAESAAAADERGLVGSRNGLPMAGMKDRWARILGYGYQYRGALVHDDGSPALLPTEPGLDGRPGTRVPHVPVHLRQDAPMATPHVAAGVGSTLDVLGRGYVVLAANQGQAWCDAARSLGLKAYRVGPDGDLVDPADAWREAAGLTPGGMVLVRPDGFVAWRAAAAEADPAGALRRAGA